LQGRDLGRLSVFWILPQSLKGRTEQAGRTAHVLSCGNVFDRHLAVLLEMASKDELRRKVFEFRMNCGNFNVCRKYDVLNPLPIYSAQYRLHSIQTPYFRTLNRPAFRTVVVLYHKNSAILLKLSKFAVIKTQVLYRSSLRDFHILTESLLSLDLLRARRRREKRAYRATSWRRLY
jgi:hypothetical protein